MTKEGRLLGGLGGTQKRTEVIVPRNPGMKKEKAQPNKREGSRDGGREQSGIRRD